MTENTVPGRCAAGDHRLCLMPNPDTGCPGFEPPDDPIAYARAHLTSPGAHALLDEVERGRQRRANREKD